MPKCYFGYCSSQSNTILLCTLWDESHLRRAPETCCGLLLISMKKKKDEYNKDLTGWYNYRLLD